MHFNGPNTRAPQTVLLAVAPDTSVASWTTANLAEVLRNTLGYAAVLRPSFTLSLSPPLIHLGQRTDGKGVCFHSQ